MKNLRVVGKTAHQLSFVYKLKALRLYHRARHNGDNYYDGIIIVITMGLFGGDDDDHEVNDRHVAIMVIIIMVRSLW